MLVFLSGLVQQRGLLQGSVCVGVPNPPHPTDPVCVCVSLACAATVAGPSCCVTAAQCKLQPLRHEESPFNTFCDVLTQWRGTHQGRVQRRRRGGGVERCGGRPVHWDLDMHMDIPGPAWSPPPRHRHGATSLKSATKHMWSEGTCRLGRVPSANSTSGGKHSTSPIRTRVSLEYHMKSTQACMPEWKVVNAGSPVVLTAEGCSRLGPNVDRTGVGTA